MYLGTYVATVVVLGVLLTFCLLYDVFQMN